MAALLRLAVLCVDPGGSVSYWNRGAEDLFGHRWEGVVGRRASGLVGTTGTRLGTTGTPPEDALDLLDDLTRPAWAGTLATTHRGGALRDVLWWSYRIVEPAGSSLLAVAADTGPLRSGGPSLVLGDRLLPYAPEPAGGEGGVRVTACLASVADPAYAARFATRLGRVLPRVGPGRLDRMLRQLLPLGHPALTVDGGVRLPVLPHGNDRGAPARAPWVAAPRRGSGRRRSLAAIPGPGAGPLPGLSARPPAGRATTGAARQDTAGPARPPGRLDEQAALLQEISARVGTSLDLDGTAHELCAVTVPRFADHATILVVEQLFSDSESFKDDQRAGTVLVRRVAVAHDGPSDAWDSSLPDGEVIALATEEITPRLSEPFLVPYVHPSVAEETALDLGLPALGALLSERSLILVPLTARGTVLGRMCFLRDRGRRRFDAHDLEAALEVVTRGAVHLDNARLHRQESRAASILQRSMMPTRPPRLPGVCIAHRYMPGDRQAQVGGDWFDAIQLPGGRVALIVGDVMGHGLLSAAVMGQFRTSVITMAALDLPPAQLLRHLDNLAHRLGPEHLATCVYAVYDPIHRTLTLANAGHIPPVLARHDGRSELLRIPEGAPIGVGGVPFETVEIAVPDGSWLVLCTDGLVEVRGQGIDAGLAALCSHVIEPQQTPEDVCEQILGRVHSEDRADDVALLVARFEGIAQEDVARWKLGMDVAEVRRARELVRLQLTRWKLERLTDVTELLVSELVTNALRAAAHDVELRLMRVGKLLVEVSDDDHNLPQLRRADAEDEEGRGLALVSHLSDRWGTSRKAVGKVVWFELPLPG